MRLSLLAVAVAAGWLVWRRRRKGASRVLVAWRDGEVLELQPGTAQHGRLVALAERAL